MATHYRVTYSGVSPASGLLGKPGTYQGSWELGSKVPPTKNGKSADLAHYFSGVAKFCVQNRETSNLKRSMSVLNRLFTAGKFLSKFHFY